MILNSTNIQRKYGIFCEPKSEKLPATDPENVNGSLHFIVVSFIILLFMLFQKDLGIGSSCLAGT